MDLMKLVGCFIILLIVCLFPSFIYSQETGEEQFDDFDLFTLRGINTIRPGNSDSSSLHVQYTSSQKGKPKKLKLIEYSQKGRSTSRKATIRQNASGTFIGFETLKTTGFEKVLFFGSRVFYYDSILVSHDTILYKRWCDRSLRLLALLPVKNDTLIVRVINKTYKHYEYPTERWKNLVNYQDWFSITNASVEIHTLVKKNDHYEIVTIKTNSKPLLEYEYQWVQDGYRDAGLSLFWIIVEGNIYL